MRALVTGLAALLILAACAENPVTGRKEFVIVSEEQAIQSSAVAYREMMGQLEKKKQVESGTPPADVCRQLGVSEATFYIWTRSMPNWVWRS